MEKLINLGGKEIKYTLKISTRAKRLRLAVYCNGDLVVTKPRFLNSNFVDQFIKDKSDWILQKIRNFSNAENKQVPLLTRRDYLNNRERARELIKERLEYFNAYYKFEYGRVNIRDQKSRWGSCSRQGNLNFNYRLLFLNSAVRDYVIVHELCHLKEFNHSSRFWELVSRQTPDYKILRNQLKHGQPI